MHALAEYEQDSRDLVSLFNRSMVHFSLGNEEESVALMNEYIGKYGEFAPYPVAMMYGWRGESDLAFEWMDKSYQLREQFLVFILGNWLLESLHSDPRFAMFLDKMGLLEYWEAMQ